MRSIHRVLLALALTSFSVHLPASAHDADHEHDKRPTLSLNASASKEVTFDTVTITLAYEHHGSSQTQVGQEVNARIAAALAKAKQVAQIKTRTGAISTWSRLDKERKPIGWTAKGTLILESTDLEAASKLAGELSDTLTFANSHFSLSRERRNQVERELLQDTANAFQERAQQAVNALGFQAFSIKNIDLSGEGNVVQQRSDMAFRVAAAPAMAAEASAPPLQLEPGTLTVTIGMHGQVYLLSAR